MTQRTSNGWVIYGLLIIAAVVATINAWVAGAPYFGNEFRTVELQKVWSVTDDDKTVWRGAFVDQTTGLEFEHPVRPKAADEFIREGNKPKVMPFLLEIGAVDPIDKERRDHYYVYRWVATGALVVLLFWWVIVQCPEIFLIFAIFD